jgi:hypothetical protein
MNDSASVRRRGKKSVIRQGRLGHSTRVIVCHGRQRLQGGGVPPGGRGRCDGDGIAAQRVHHRIVLRFGDVEVAAVEVAHQQAVTFQKPADPLANARYQNLQCVASSILEKKFTNYADLLIIQEHRCVTHSGYLGTGRPRLLQHGGIGLRQQQIGQRTTRYQSRAAHRIPERAQVDVGGRGTAK